MSQHHALLAVTCVAVAVAAGCDSPKLLDSYGLEGHLASNGELFFHLFTDDADAPCVALSPEDITFNGAPFETVTGGTAFDIWAGGFVCQGISGTTSIAGAGEGPDGEIVVSDGERSVSWTGRDLLAPRSIAPVDGAAAVAGATLALRFEPPIAEGAIAPGFVVDVADPGTILVDIPAGTPPGPLALDIEVFGAVPTAASTGLGDTVFTASHTQTLTVDVR